jgi:hypothetical protein
MTTPKEALRPFAACIFNDNGDITIDTSHLRTEDYMRAKSALASLQGEDAVERVARTICQSGKFETGQGTCAVICMDQLGDVRKKGCGHCKRVHGAMARAILATGLVPDEAAVRADEREKWARVADSKRRSVREFSVAADIAAAIRSGGAK